MRCSIRRNLILKYRRCDSGLSSLGTKSPFVCQFSINFLKYFLDGCFIPGKSEKTLGAYVQSCSWTVKYSSGLRRLNLTMSSQRHAPFFLHSIQQDKGKEQQGRINLSCQKGRVVLILSQPKGLWQSNRGTKRCCCSLCFVKLFRTKQARYY